MDAADKRAERINDGPRALIHAVLTFALPTEPREMPAAMLSLRPLHSYTPSTRFLPFLFLLCSPFHSLFLFVFSLFAPPCGIALPDGDNVNLTMKFKFIS